MILTLISDKKMMLTSMLLGEIRLFFHLNIHHVVIFYIYQHGVNTKIHLPLKQNHSAHCFISLSDTQHVFITCCLYSFYRSVVRYYCSCLFLLFSDLSDANAA